MLNSTAIAWSLPKKLQVKLSKFLSVTLALNISSSMLVFEAYKNSQVNIYIYHWLNSLLLFK